jgi:hypothetical protein
MTGRPATLLIALALLGSLATVVPAAHGTDARFLPRAAAGGARTGAPSARAAPCGRAIGETLATADGMVAMRIYDNELGGSETQSDLHQIETFTPLLSAMASGDRSATEAAVSELVFSHTHVVRLRVIHQGTVLADIGGPYILAPVSGTLHYEGRPVGRYVMSVQDDLGYVKLVSRFIGVPLTLRSGSQTIPVEGAIAPAIATIPAHGPLQYEHVHYQAFSFDARSFPDGPLRVSLLVPIPGGLARKSCSEIRARELAEIAARISHRYELTPANLDTYIRLVRNLTGGLLYVRAGSHQLAGSSPRGPRKLPDSGPIRYAGASWEVSSFLAHTSAGQARVYLIVHRI